MAYANLINELCADKAEVFCRMRDYICKRNGTYDYSATGIGWVLLDSSYAVDEDNPQLGDYFVIGSTGESGDEDLYFKIEWASGYFLMTGYQSWDPSTHAGANQYGSGNNFYLQEAETNIYLNVYGDLEFLSCFYEYATGDHRACFFGLLECVDNAVNRDVATCSSALTAGSDVSITVDAVPSDWEVGRQLWIRTTHTNDTSTVKIEVVTIKTLAGNTITVDLANNYTAGSKLCVFFAYVCPNTYVSFTTTITMSISTGHVAQTVSCIFTNLTQTYLDPLDFEDRYGLTDILVQGATSWPLSKFKHVKFLGAAPVAPMLDGDAVEDLEGNVWRMKKIYSNKFVGIREV